MATIGEMTTYAGGHDFGNTEVCDVILSGKNSVFRSMPTASSQGTLKALKNLEIEMKEDFYVYSDETTSGLYIGRLAIEQAYESFSGRNDDSRYESVHSRRALLVGMSSMIKAKRFALNLVTGIPVKLYKEEGEPIRTRIANALNGEHVFNINGIERVARIHVDRVIMEGAAALRPYGLRDEKTGLPDKVNRQAVIDIGGGTSDLIGAIGQTYQQNWCDSKEIGVETVKTLLAINFKALHPKRSLAPIEVNQILHAYISKGKIAFPPIYDSGREVSVEEISRLVKEALEEVGVRIVSFVKSTWKSEVGRFKVIILIGGGAYYFYDILKVAFPQVTLVFQPESANALGYASLANIAVQKMLAEK